jgi:hypothetical protein
MAVFADALDLKMAVGDTVGNRDISDVYSSLLQRAELMLNRKLRVRQQITSDTVSMIDGVGDLPSDFLEMLHVYDGCGNEYAAGTMANMQREGSQYFRYAIDGSSLLIRGVSGDRNIEYYAALPTLAGSMSATNWLLTDGPDVYLYAVSFEAAKHLKDVDLSTALKGLLDSALSDLGIQDERARYGSATVRVAGITP